MLQKNVQFVEILFSPGFAVPTEWNDLVTILRTRAKSCLLEVIAKFLSRID